jgi:hypothetical protein
LRVFSGIQPSGRLHIGNYFGAMRQHIQMQHGNDCFFFIADITPLRATPRRKTFQISLGVAMDSCMGPDPKNYIGDSRMCLNWSLRAVVRYAYGALPVHNIKTRLQGKSQPWPFAYPLCRRRISLYKTMLCPGDGPEATYQVNGISLGISTIHTAARCSCCQRTILSNR